MCLTLKDSIYHPLSIFNSGAPGSVIPSFEGVA